MSCTVPILFLVFNRPGHTRLSLERIRQARPPRLYVHCDGPRAHIAGEAEKVAAVRAIIGGVDWPCEVHTLFRERNYGLREGVCGALNWFFQQETRGIVLEDDCLPDQSFFSFCEILLERYADDEEVMHISGSNLAERYTARLPDSYVFSRFSFVWGWAGWRRAWAKMSVALEGLDVFEREERIAGLTRNRMAQAYMADKFRATQQRRNNSWAYAWFYSILKNKGICIVPKINLVQNTGVGDRDATHTTGRDKNKGLRASAMPFPLQHPLERTPRMPLEDRFFYATQKKWPRLLLWYIMRLAGLR